MSRRRASSPAAVLVFGESKNDADSIRELLVHEHPDLVGVVRTAPRPTSLTRDAGSAAVGRWVDQIAEVVAALGRRGVAVRAVVVHRDADGPDLTGAEEARLRGQLSAIDGLPVVPVQTMEAWWFHFADATESVRPLAWRRALPRRQRIVDSIDQPKTELRRLTGAKGYEYAEADSFAIASAVRNGRTGTVGTSPSYERFSATARSL